MPVGIDVPGLYPYVVVTQDSTYSASTIVDLRDVIEEQQRLIKEQNAEIERLRRQLASQPTPQPQSQSNTEPEEKPYGTRFSLLEVD